MSLRLTFTTSLLAAGLAFTAYGQSVRGQKPSAATAIPRTPNGHPDLQGNWLNNSATPFERPKELEGRESLTDQEVAELNRRAKKIFANPKSDAATTDGYFMAAYRNLEVYTSGGATDSAERVTEMEIDNRTSIITDPPDGKLPALTEAGQRRRAAYGRSRSGGGFSPNGPDQVAPSDRCITYGVPRVNGVYSAGLHGYYQIVQTPDNIVCSLRTSTKRVLFPWMEVRISRRMFVSGPETREGGGTATRWWWIPLISARNCIRSVYRRSFI